MWRSLVAHLAWDEGAARSNRVIPTIFIFSMFSLFVNLFKYFIPIDSFIKKLKEFYLYKNNNNVFIIKNINGKKIRKLVKTNGQIKGLHIIFVNAKNNIIEIEEPFKFKNVVFCVNGDNNLISIKENSHIYNHYINISLGAKCIIGKNFKSVYNGNFQLGGFASLNIGDNCLFSRNISIYAGDGHIVKDLNSHEILNWVLHPVSIGNHVWVGDSSMILKNSIIPSGSIVAANSLVNKEFQEKNIIIAGNPAKIIKKNIYWEY